MFELALSNNSFYEVSDSGNLSYIDWAFEVQNYWTQLLNGYDASNSEPFDGHGVAMDQKLNSGRFGFLSRKDFLLVRDAVLLECDAFLTLDKKLVKNRVFIEKELGLKVVQPIDFWEMLQPWAALFV